MRATVGTLLARHPDLTGVVVHNEPAVPLLLDAFDSLGRGVTHDVSVVAIGPDDLAERATEAYEAARETVRGFVNAPAARGSASTPSCWPGSSSPAPPRPSRRG